MIKDINSINEVKKYASLLVSEGTSFHPDNDFSDYINLKSGDNAYSEEEINLRNRLMDKCFSICEKEGEDIYEIMLEVYLQKTGLSKEIIIDN